MPTTMVKLVALKQLLLCFFVLIPLQVMALDYDKWGVWVCGVRDGNSELVNIGSACRDRLYHYENNFSVAPIEGKNSDEQKQKSCGGLFTGSGLRYTANSLCFTDDSYSCKPDSINGVQCTSQSVCSDQDDDGWFCCPQGKECVSGVPNACTMQDCSSGASIESRFCTDSDKKIFPGAPVVNNQLVSVKAELDPVYQEEYNRARYTNLKSPTVWTPVKVTVTVKYCVNPALNFRGKMSVLLDGKNGSATEVSVAEVEGIFELVKRDGNGFATYELRSVYDNGSVSNATHLFSPLLYPTKKSGLSIEGLQTLVVQRIGTGEPVRLNVVAQEQREGAEESFYPPLEQGVRDVIPYTNCMPVYGKGSYVRVAFRFHKNLADQVDSYEYEDAFYAGANDMPSSVSELVRNDWNSPEKYIKQGQTITDHFFTVRPHQLLKDRMTFNVDLLPIEADMFKPLSDRDGATLQKILNGKPYFQSPPQSCLNPTHSVLFHQTGDIYHGFAILKEGLAFIDPIYIQTYFSLSASKGVNDVSTVVIHELGHSFAKLNDEYVHPRFTDKEESKFLTPWDKLSNEDRAYIVSHLLPNCTLYPDIHFRLGNILYGSTKDAGCARPNFFRPSTEGLMACSVENFHHNIIGCAHILAHGFGKIPQSFYEQCESMPGIITDRGP